MVPFPILQLLVLGSVDEVTASVLFGRQQPPPNSTTTVAFDKRQGTALVTKFSTIFSGGDASNTRTAESGFDIRVDVANGAWGFCATSNPGQCDMAGSCFDSFSCSKGCGFGNTALKTLTCSGSNARFCSTALLTLASDIPRAFTYLGCADKARTEEYKAFTTNAKQPSVSCTPPSPLPTAVQPPGTATSQTTTSTSSTPTTQTAPQSRFTTTTTSATGRSMDTTNPGSTSTSSPPPSLDSPNNTPAIIGAVVGCVALICICVVAVFLIRRSRNASASATAAPAAAAPAAAAAAVASAAATREGGPEHDGPALALALAASREFKAPALPVSATEVSGRGHAGYDTGRRGPVGGRGRVKAAVAPVELPAVGGSGELPGSGRYV